jgi:hypothetical protein
MTISPHLLLWSEDLSDGPSLGSSLIHIIHSWNYNLPPLIMLVVLFVRLVAIVLLDGGWWRGGGQKIDGWLEANSLPTKVTNCEGMALRFSLRYDGFSIGGLR